MVRRELSGPVTAARREALRSSIADAVRTVSEIMARHRLPPAALPAPTRHAYQYLTSLDLDRVPVVADESRSGEPATGDVRMVGLRAVIDALCDKLAICREHDDLQPVQRLIERRMTLVESEMNRIRISARHLTEESRRSRAWLAFMCGPGRLAEYVRAVQLARPILDAAAPGTRFAPPTWVHFRPTSSLYSVKPIEDGTRVTLQTAMMAWSWNDFAVLAAAMFRRRADRKRIDDAMQSEGCRALRAELARLEESDGRTGGAFHDLNEAFDRVNQHYFNGAMPRPRLIWSEQPTGCKFGHYDAAHDTLMLSMTLDAAGVPAYVVDFVTYHELLHKQLGTQWRNGRRRVHTPEFRRRERQFRQYAEAETYLNRLSAAYVRGATPVPHQHGAAGS